MQRFVSTIATGPLKPNISRWASNHCLVSSGGLERVYKFSEFSSDRCQWITNNIPCRSCGSRTEPIVLWVNWRPTVSMTIDGLLCYCDRACFWAFIEADEEKNRIAASLADYLTSPCSLWGQKFRTKRRGWKWEHTRARLTMLFCILCVTWIHKGEIMGKRGTPSASYYQSISISCGNCVWFLTSFSLLHLIPTNKNCLKSNNNNNNSVYCTTHKPKLISHVNCPRFGSLPWCAHGISSWNTAAVAVAVLVTVIRITSGAWCMDFNDGHWVMSLSLCVSMCVQREDGTPEIRPSKCESLETRQRPPPSWQQATCVPIIIGRV